MLLRALPVVLLSALGAWLLFAPLADPLAWSALQGGLALLLGRMAGLRGAMALSAALFAPLLLGAAQLGLPPWLYALAAALVFALSRNAWRERVPFYLSSGEACRTLARWLPERARLLDAGCGDGRMLLALARQRPDLQLSGVENAPLPFALAWLRWRLGGRPANVCLRYGSLWQADLAAQDVIYAFLSPAPMPRLWQHFCAAGAAQARLVSNTFTVPGVAADEILPLTGPLQRELLIWRHPHAT